jgi:predicted N-acetyltransferase YhbS
MAIEGPRGAKPDEIPAVVELADSVFRVGEDESMGEEFPLLYVEENAENLRIFLDDGRPVSLVAMFRREVVLAGTRHGSCAIGSVCTDPDYRGQGLATRLLKDARERAVRSGDDIFLISGGRGLYTRQGYTDVGDYASCTVTQKRMPEGNLKVKPWTPDDVPQLVRLHSLEPTRFVRGPEDLLALLKAERVVNAQADTRLVLDRDGRPVAYVTYRRPGSRRTAEDEIIIDELAGSRAAIVQALPALFKEYDIRRVTVNHLGGDAEMAALARHHRWPTESGEFGGTVGIVEPARFWAACEPLSRERLGNRFKCLSFHADERITIACGEEKLELDGMEELTQLAFLPPHRRDELETGLPEDSHLRAVLDRLFPLPLVSYGLNYV